MNHLIKSCVFIITFLAISWVLPGQVLGLSCANAILEPAERLEKSAYVFVGRVVDSSDGPGKVAISKTYKGDLPREVTVKLSSMWDSFSVKPGAEYLFLLDRYEPSTKTASRDLCNYNATVETSSVAFEPYEKLLNNLKNPYKTFALVGIAVFIGAIIGYKVISRGRTKKK